MVLPKPKKPHELLNKALSSKLEIQSGYSQRALARDLGVSSAFITKIFTGQRPIPVSRLKKLCRLLGMDPTAEAALLRSIVFYSLPNDELRNLALSSSLEKFSTFDEKRVSHRKLSVLNRWYNLAILNLLSCEIEASPKVIARKLNLPLSEVEQSLESLKKLELAVEQDGIWTKAIEHGFIPTTKSQAEVRDFHREMIKKAYAELARTNEQAFKERIITGFTISCDLDKVEIAKRMVFDFLKEVSDTLSSGNCTDVYQCNVQLFPLTKTGQHT